MKSLADRGKRQAEGEQDWIFLCALGALARETGENGPLAKQQGWLRIGCSEHHQRAPARDFSYATFSPTPIRVLPTLTSDPLPLIEMRGVSGVILDAGRAIYLPGRGRPQGFLRGRDNQFRDRIHPPRISSRRRACAASGGSRRARKTLSRSH